MPARNTLVQLSRIHQPWKPQCTALQTDRRMDRRKDNRMMPITDIV